jgi:hypothetical protein
MRKRSKTEHMGFQATVEEERNINAYCQSRRMTKTEVFREWLQPILQGQVEREEQQDLQGTEQDEVEHTRVR